MGRPRSGGSQVGLPGAGRTQIERTGAARSRTGGFELLLALVAVMWVVEIVNTADSNRLDADGLYPRNVAHLWGILTAPFLHASFQHLISNTIPLVFMGAIIALRGAFRLAAVTGIVIVLGGLLTWLVSPGGVVVGASGLVFGYAGYLLARGFFDRSPLELLVGAVVGVLWGGALLASVVPQPHISWEGHICGAIAGVVAAALLASSRTSRTVTAQSA
ncbi:MAG: rhomboid family intramembrane serine protease [Solirubrobacterales bacterium]|nr:rhomboid family intramembrane serine protease [Solirubrobacterales bacterium]